MDNLKLKDLESEFKKCVELLKDPEHRKDNDNYIATIKYLGQIVDALQEIKDNL